LILCEPVSYVEMLALEKNARVIVTDSGGVQKEAYYFQVPAVLPRSTTEWAELARAGWAAVTGPDTRRIIDAVQSFWENGHAVGWKPFYGNGDASMKIAAETERYLFHVQEVLS
jgi:UDP-N-acetylglucosamine 2-epimerase